jgi:hypothetical protein
VDISNEARLERLAAAGNEALDRYENGEVGFQWRGWTTEGRQAWVRLEITNAVMYAEKRKAPTEEQQRVITTAIRTLRELLKSHRGGGPSLD